ncbi:MAG: metallophosphoesterase [Hyphomicrobiaceae bacterium]|nr:metallophosphoesterase [Hyphomicrobiaceae bacterium]
MLTRRHFLQALATLGFSGTALGSYALAEPFRTDVTSYAIMPPSWPAGLNLRLAVLADLHAIDPWVSVKRLESLVAQTNELEPDAILLLGDFVVGHRLGHFGRPVPHDDWAQALAGLKAPLGVHAVLGNHDWWEDRAIQSSEKGPVRAAIALQNAGIPVYENDAIRLEKDGRPFWIAGLGDQWAFWPKPDRYADFVRRGRVDYRGVDDLPGTLAKITDDAPVILMAHEPDIFPDVPKRVALTLSGHTHGGQVRLFGYAPVVPSKFKARYVYGHIVEEERHLVVSGGIGCSGLPVRFGSPPEIVVVELGKRVTA